MTGEKRATDHLEPAAKKRGSERQITKDDISEGEDEQVEAGTFARASEDVLKQRKIVRARRPPAVPPTQSAAAGATNPFASVQLQAPAEGSAAVPPSAPANPFAGVSLVPDQPALGGEAKDEETGTKPITDAGSTFATDQVTKKETAKENKEVATEQTVKPTMAGGFGALSSQGGGLSFGSSVGGFGSLKSTTGGFGFLASGGTATPASGGLAFGGTTAIATATTTGKASENETGTAVMTTPSIFGSATAIGTSAFRSAPSTKPSLPDLPKELPTKTGEESEETCFSGVAVLFSFNPVKKEWSNRGSGSLKVNVNKETGQARLVMRQKDTLRLLLNANLWPGLHLTAQEGQSGMSFTCFNHIDSNGGELKDGEEGKGIGQPQLETFAVKLRKVDVPQFEKTVMDNMPKEENTKEKE